MNPNEKTIPVFILALLFILILFSIFYLDYLDLINDIFSQSVRGFFFVRTKASTLDLTTDGNLTIEFLNLWPGTITILNISANNNDSGICTIPRNSLLYKNKKQNLPLTVSMGDAFSVHAVSCTPFKKPPKRGERFSINMTIEYIIGGSYMASYGKDAMHTESGRLEGRYVR